MFRKVKIGKILAVLFLTVLIWVWADLAKTEEYTIQSSVLRIVQSANSKLWASFPAGQSITIERLVVKGATSRIDRLRRDLKAGKSLEFDLELMQEHIDEPGNHTLVLQPFLDRQMSRFGLKVESCKPEKVTVIVRRLVKKSLEVRCFDKDQNPVPAGVDPPEVEIAIPEGMEGFARVQLSDVEIRQAKGTVLKKKPFFRLPGGQRITADRTVEITMPMGLLKPERIDSPRLGFLIGANVQGKYEVKVENLVDVIGPISIRATAEAKIAYEAVPYQVILEVYDEDVKSTEPVIKRTLKYNFPPEYVRRGEIELNQQPVEARFRLVPILRGEQPTGAGS